MGDPSDLRFVPSSCATTPIDWTKVPEASKKFLLAGWTYYSYESDSEGSGSLPATIGDLAKMLDGSKFFGYMTHSISTLLSDISEFGLAEHCSTKSIGLPVGPRFYMKFLDQIGFVLFVPGYRDGIIGYSPDIPYTDDWNEDAGIARDKALAEDYDAKLCKEVWFVLFTPGSRHAISGYSPKIPHGKDSFEATGIAPDKAALAEDYDAKLCEEIDVI
ncbi:uncharacterized protein LACBIDRAFT_332807 [Laccaria bicolor S238N-H82]|uniref:Predicted protein n=1 Tax=Laccaria bicolor (strain S238N-H82 / ATCC MYA-4686) TaxID=486041 RepID=B0DTS0_LACBS|nr:uncharacterized protein LACBIDRAFT_332807 [Laccaria bicolor S238N-H82]EDR02030.1 predicted protein [Laccaria bicolor S238N-H82]|eukprot:XP_001887421.1 predicted protein [Laccaria bicolor S238N-H82]